MYELFDWKPLFLGRLKPEWLLPVIRFASQCPGGASHPSRYFYHVFLAGAKIFQHKLKIAYKVEINVEKQTIFDFQSLILQWSPPIYLKISLKLSTENEVFYDSVYFNNWNIYKLCHICQKRSNITKFFVSLLFCLIVIFDQGHFHCC